MLVVMKNILVDKKATTENYHNLYVEKRGDGDGKPEKIGAKELEEANYDPLS